jgi:hypothetical protein
LLDGDHGAQFSGIAEGSFEHEKIGMPLRGDTAGDRMIGIEGKRARRFGDQRSV